MVITTTLFVLRAWTRAVWSGILISFFAVVAICVAVFYVLFGRSRLPVFLFRLGALLAENLGGAFLKIGQLLSTRIDLLPEEAIQVLSRLQDKVKKENPKAIELALAKAFGEPEYVFSFFEFDPVATGTIAQVHRARLRGSERCVAVKIKRAGIDAIVQIDVICMKLVAKIISLLPWFKRIPVWEATQQLCSAILGQIDFEREVEALCRFRDIFAENEQIRVPAPVTELCGPNVIVMEYLDGLERISFQKLHKESNELKIVCGLRALYEMIFHAGFIHCDLHPGNILSCGNAIAIIDMGFVAELRPESQIAFAKFFESIFFKDGKTAASVIMESSVHIEGTFEHISFERDMQALIEGASGRKAGEFQVALFVNDLFRIQSRHGIYGSPEFTLPILSLVAYEGLIKQVHPMLDFQREVLPFVLSCLSMKSVKHRKATHSNV
jgi:ubiquinone biosynthesis protein